MVIKIIWWIITVVLAVLVGYDALTALIERYSHFHIGRWESIQVWEDKAFYVCRKWMKKTPKLRMNDQCRYLLLDRLQGKYSKAMVQSWQTAGCILGVKEKQPDEWEYYKTVRFRLIDQQGEWTIDICRVDYAMLAYAILKYESDPNAIVAAMNQMVAYIEDNICKDGMVSYSAGKEGKRRYVDTLGFVCPFLALYAKKYDKPQYAELAVSQYEKFRACGIMNGLPVHCYMADSKLPIGIYGWGRGIGWYVLGLIDMYPELDERHQGKVESWILEIADLCIAYERQDGGFSTILQTDHKHDSSATAMIGYFYAKCADLFGNVRYLKIAERCRRKLMALTKINGVVDGALADTKDVGVFSQRYGSMPFAQGMTVRLSAVLDKLGD